MYYRFIYLPAVIPAKIFAKYSLTPKLTKGRFVPSYNPNMSDSETVRCASGGKMPRYKNAKPSCRSSLMADFISTPCNI